MEPTPGLLLDDRYELLSPLEGLGNGPTWRACDPDVRERHFTLKFLRPVEGDALPAALTDHLRALRALRHPGVLTTVSHGVFEGTPYLVQSPFEGVSLRRHLAARTASSGRCTTAELDALFRSIAAAVSAAHAASPPVVHGDLHPDAVVIAPSERGPGARVLDFGLTPFLPSESALSHKAFVAPERSAQLAPDVTADVFSLARLLAMMLDEASFSDARSPRARASARRDDVPEAVWHTLERATAPHPRQRFASVNALLDALTDAWKAPRPAPVIEAPAPTPAPPPEAPPRIAFEALRAPPPATPAALENPWGTDVRMRRVEAPEGFMARAFSPANAPREEPAAATDVMAPWSLPGAPSERTEALSASAFRPAPDALAPEESTRRVAPFAPVDPPDEKTTQLAPFRPVAPPAPRAAERVDAPHSTTPATPAATPPKSARALVIGAVLALIALAALLALAR